MSNGNLVDTIIRGATIDLLESYSIATAPIVHKHPHEVVKLPDVAASIEFDAPGFSGTLYVCCPRDLIPNSANTQRKATAEDWVRELANQLLGRVKRRLLQSNLNLRTGLPKTGNSELIKRRFERREPARRYDFRTLRGPIVLLLEGTISDTVVSYQGSAADASEGDVILFGSEGPVD